MVEQEIKEKLDRSASKIDRPTPEMPGMHQPSAFSRKILVSLNSKIKREELMQGFYADAHRLMEIITKLNYPALYYYYYCS